MLLQELVAIKKNPREDIFFLDTMIQSYKVECNYYCYY